MEKVAKTVSVCSMEKVAKKTVSVCSMERVAKKTVSVCSMERWRKLGYVVWSDGGSS